MEMMQLARLWREMDGFLHYSPHLWRCYSETKNLMQVNSLLFIGNEEMRENNIKMMFVEENEWNSLRNQKGCRRWWKFNGNDRMWWILTRTRENSINSEQTSLVLICLWFKTQFNSFCFFFPFFLFFVFFFSFSFGIFCLVGNFVFLCQRISKKIEHSKYFWWNYCIVPQHSIFFHTLRHGKFQSDDIIID